MLTQETCSAGTLTAPNTFTILASPSGPPFRKGDAAVRVLVTVGNETACCISGSSGIQTIRLR